MLISPPLDPEAPAKVLAARLARKGLDGPARAALLEALGAVGIPYGITLHDHYLACPTIALVDDRGEYCRRRA